MIVKFRRLSDGSPVAWWDDPMAPEAFVASFLRSEIGFQLSNVDEFLRAIDEVEQARIPSWTWHGNNFSLRIDPCRCLIEDHYPDLIEGQTNQVVVPPGAFRTILKDYFAFASEHGFPQETSQSTEGGENLSGIKLQVNLKVNPEEALSQLRTIPHEKFQQAIQNNWRLTTDGKVTPASVYWLFCWAKTGMSSNRAAKAARRVFDQLFDVSYRDFDKAVDHETARANRCDHK